MTSFWIRVLLFLTIAMVAVGWGLLAADAMAGTHSGRISKWEGTKTCVACHTGEANDAHSSVHYQWAGDTSEILGKVPDPAGKINGINDFCIYAAINWVGKLQNVDGVMVDGGCAKCHAGMGAKPKATPSQGQLENIDCLICHSKDYKRKVEMVGTTYKFVPDTANMTVSILQAAQNVTRPTKDACLNCHTKSGGGDNYKRGDIEEAHRNAKRAFDVHMASTANGGAGLECTDCHKTISHKIAGRGSDLRERDTFDVRVSCTDCHSTTPHGDGDLDKHTGRVNCTVCHIPTFARGAPTDMNRDWSKPGEVDAAKKLYDPYMVKRRNVVPVYAFFNGKSYAYSFGAKAIPRSNGRIPMSLPAGKITDPTAKIHAFKRHVGRQPIDPVTSKLLPLKTGIFFQTGDLAAAVKQGVQEVGWPDNGYTFANTERYMGIFHEVAPKENALSCSNCHGGTRLDFKALGYTPVSTRNSKPLCASCHDSETADFNETHDKHVRDEGYDCSTCHTFQAAK